MLLLFPQLTTINRLPIWSISSQTLFSLHNNRDYNSETAHFTLHCALGLNSILYMENFPISLHTDAHLYFICLVAFQSVNVPSFINYTQNGGQRFHFFKLLIMIEILYLFLYIRKYFQVITPRSRISRSKQIDNLSFGNTTTSTAGPSHVALTAMCKSRINLGGLQKTF